MSMQLMAMLAEQDRKIDELEHRVELLAHAVRDLADDVESINFTVKQVPKVSPGMKAINGKLA